LTRIIYYKLVEVCSKKHSLATTLHFVNENICKVDEISGSKSSYGPVLHSYIWISYTSKASSYQKVVRARLLSNNTIQYNFSLWTEGWYDSGGAC
jgi:hypothetical protein